MSRAVAIGDGRRLAGYALAGALVVPVGPDEAVDAWETLPDDLGLVLLSPEVEAVLAPRLAERQDVVWAVLP